MTGSDPADRLLERDVLAGLVAAPALFEQVAWLRAEDFTDTGVAEVFQAARQLRDAGRPVDLVTLSAHISPGYVGDRTSPPSSTGRADQPTAAAAVCAELKPEHALLATVPFLARRILEDSTVRDAAAVGEALVHLAGAPGSAGGLGRPQLDAALICLDSLRPHAERLEQAHRPIAVRRQDLGRRDQRTVRTDPRRLAASRTVDSDRHAS